MRAVWIEKVVENFEQFCRDWYDTVWISIRVQIPQAASKQKMCGKTEDILVTWARRYLVTRYDIWLWQDPKLWCCRGRNDKSFCGLNDHHDEQCVLKVLVQSGKKHYCVCVLGTVGKVERGGRRNWSIKIETSPVDSSIHQFIIHRENEILQITPEGFLFVLIKSTHWKYTQSSYCWLKSLFDLRHICLPGTCRHQFYGFLVLQGIKIFAALFPSCQIQMFPPILIWKSGFYCK